MEQIEKRLTIIETRNKRVELDKAWKTSWTRRISIAVLTYIVITLFFLIAGLEKPFINPLVPTGGFLLSTISIQILKKMWILQKR